MIVGLVGKPSAGKSTFFRAATLADAEIGNYPFTTIKPNHGIGFINFPCVDSFFGKQCNPRTGFCLNRKRFVPIDLMDVAGLVKGAHEGKGRGNQFLDDLNRTDILIHILDISGSTNDKGENVEALSYDPLNDVKFLEDELNFWYLRLIKKGWEKFARKIQQEQLELYKALAKQLSGLGVTEEISKYVLKNFNPDPIKWTEDDLMNLAKILREITKPIIIAANKIDVQGSEKNFEKLLKEYPNLVCIKCSAESELALKEADKNRLIEYVPGEKDFKIKGKLNEKQKKALEFIKEKVLDKFGGTGIQDVLNRAVFDVLKYIPIYPGGVNKLADSDGNILPDCFLMKNNSTALDFAYKLHTDFGEKFIRAIDVKKKITVGKDYLLKFGDVIEIICNR